MRPRRVKAKVRKALIRSNQPTFFLLHSNPEVIVSYPLPSLP